MYWFVISTHFKIPLKLFNKPSSAMHQTYNNIIILKTQRPPRFFIERFTIFNCMLDIKIDPIFHNLTLLIIPVKKLNLTID